MIDSPSSVAQTLTLALPEGFTRCDFGYVYGKWSCWAVRDLRYFRGQGVTMQAAFDAMIFELENGREVWTMKNIRQAEKPKELDGRTREGKSVTKELYLKDLKDLF